MVEETIESNLEEIKEESRPLWMPKGSIRAILVMALLATVCYATLTGLFEDIPPAINTLLSMAFGFYFGQAEGK